MPCHAKRGTLLHALIDESHSAASPCDPDAGSAPLVCVDDMSHSQRKPDASSSRGSRIKQEGCPGACLNREVGGWVCGRRLE